MARRGFVWKLGLVYADGDFDKSQRLEMIVVEKVIMQRCARETSLPKTSGLCSCRQVTRTCGCLVPGEKHGVGRQDAVAGEVRNGGAEKIWACIRFPWQALDISAKAGIERASEIVATARTECLVSIGT